MTTTEVVPSSDDGEDPLFLLAAETRHARVTLLSDDDAMVAAEEPAARLHISPAAAKPRPAIFFSYIGAVRK